MFSASIQHLTRRNERNYGKLQRGCRTLDRMRDLPNTKEGRQLLNCGIKNNIKVVLI
jgi:hypothetical protein